MREKETESKSNKIQVIGDSKVKVGEEHATLRAIQIRYRSRIVNFKEVVKKTCSYYGVFLGRRISQLMDADKKHDRG